LDAEQKKRILISELKRDGKVQKNMEKLAPLGREPKEEEEEEISLM